MRPATKKPLVGVGRYTSPDLMVELVTSGLLDIIGGARPSIADPFLPKKIEEGRLDEIRECIGCNICAGRFNQHAKLICTQNATAGEEYRRGWHPEKVSRGGQRRQRRARRRRRSGRDGVRDDARQARDAPRPSRRRGARDRRLRSLDSQLPGLGEWARIVNYRQIQLDKLANVEVITGTRLDAAGILGYGAELVVVATGSHWSRDGVSGFTHEPIAGADAPSRTS